MSSQCPSCMQTETMRSILSSSTTLLLAIIFLNSHVVSAQNFYARSIHLLTSLAQKDIRIVKSLLAATSHIPATVPLYQVMDKYIKDFTDSHGSPKDSPSMVQRMVSNPLAVYRLIRRRAYLLKDVNGFQDGDLPVKSDLEDAMDAILRLHHVYNLSIAEFANGVVRGVRTKTKLYAIHFHEIGIHARSRQMYVEAIAWLRTARALARREKTVDLVTIRNDIREVIRLHDENYEFARGNPSSFVHQFSSVSTNGTWNLSIQTNRDALSKSHTGKLTEQWGPNFWSLCSGVDLRTENMKRYLFCWLEQKIHPSYTIGPVKMEFLVRDPDLVQIYDVFTDKEIESIKGQVSELTPSRVFVGDGKAYLSEGRTSTSTPIYDLDGAAEPIKKIEYITSLQTNSLSSSEYAQIVTYTTGSHYDPHQDAVDDGEITPEHMVEDGNRIATFMTYLNKVDQGGYTAFPMAFGAGRPVKGSAIFWFNLYSDGTVDKDTLHGACPVLMGQKWVVNKWILANDQFSVRKCGLKPKQRYQIAVNGKFPPYPVKREVEYERLDSDEGSSESNGECSRQWTAPDESNLTHSQFQCHLKATEKYDFLFNSGARSSCKQRCNCNRKY